MPIREVSIYKTNLNCNLKQCLNHIDGSCELTVPFAKRLTPNSIHCKFYDNNFDESWHQYKNLGGTMSALIRLRKGLGDDTEIKPKVKPKRKNAKESKKNTLDEMF